MNGCQSQQLFHSLLCLKCQTHMYWSAFCDGSTFNLVPLKRGRWSGCCYWSYCWWGGDYFSLQKLQVCFFLGNLEFNKWDFKLDYLKLTWKGSLFYLFVHLLLTLRLMLNSHFISEREKKKKERRKTRL